MGQGSEYHTIIAEKFPSRHRINPEYGGQDCDTLMFLHHFDEPKDSKVLEVGANEEAACRILADTGYDVVGIDLREHNWRLPHNYTRIEGDFVHIVRFLKPEFDSVFSLSAIEHFGFPLYGFPKLYGQPERIPDYDIQAMDLVHSLLKVNGTCYITVPYGREFLEEPDWRVYDKGSLRDRIIGDFWLEKKLFFLSGDCDCPDKDGIVTEEDADNWCGQPPHVTVFLQMRK